MPYTSIWDESAPLGSMNAKLLDDKIRALKVDIRERLNTIEGVAIGTALSDPINDSAHSLATIKTKVDTFDPLLAVSSYELWIHGLAGHFYPVTYAQPGTSVTDGLSVSQATHASASFVVYDLSAVPVGTTIQSFTIYWQATLTTGQITGTLYKQALPVFAATSLGTTGVLNGAGFIGTATTTLITLGTPYVVVTGFDVLLHILFTLGGGNQAVIYGVKVNYTSPSAQVRR